MYRLIFLLSYVYCGPGLAAGVVVVENGSDSGYRNISLSEYRAGVHYAYEAACHWFYAFFQRKNLREPTYREWRDWQSQWRAERTTDQINAIVKCPVCSEHVTACQKDGVVPFSVDPEFLDQMRSIGLNRLANDLARRQQ